MIQPLEALHYITEECQLNVTETYIQAEPDVTAYSFGNAAPNYRYAVKINASTGAGSGPQRSIDITTLSAGTNKVFYSLHKDF